MPTPSLSVPHGSLSKPTFKLTTCFAPLLPVEFLRILYDLMGVLFFYYTTTAPPLPCPVQINSLKL
jgi:hypothetical protein